MYTQCVHLKTNCGSTCSVCRPDAASAMLMLRELPFRSLHNHSRPCTAISCNRHPQCWQSTMQLQHVVSYAGHESKEACIGPNKVALTTAMTSSARQLSLRCLGSCKQSTMQQRCPMFTPLHPPSVQKVHSIQSECALQAQILHGYNNSAMKHT